MNIFVLSKSPRLAAAYHCDRHVVKMCLEYAQIISTAARIHGKAVGYKATHQRHPCVLWATECVENAQWLMDLLFETGEEYQKRYGRNHKSVDVGLEAWSEARHRWPVRGSKTPFALAMPEQYRSRDAVASYRAYYIGEKTWATWKTTTPHWFTK